jgi:hypothetical protein
MRNIQCLIIKAFVESSTYPVYTQQSPSMSLHRTQIPKNQQQHESTLHRGHRLCGVEIFHTQIGRCFQLTLLLKCDYLALRLSTRPSETTLWTL